MPRWLRGSELPDPEEDADEYGLVALGGDLNPDYLLRAYQAGIFPWSSDPVLNWWSPDPRVIFELDSFHISRTVRRSARRGGWRFVADRDFAGVMRACAEPTADRPTTWIGADFMEAYLELHRRGFAHSVEVYEGDELVGGLYGVAIGGFFGGESMFHRRSDASKAALAYLVALLRVSGFQLLDGQVPNPHLERLGAVKISRRDYLRRLRAALRAPARWSPHLLSDRLE
ncbi:MAG: leucyl/phenylalanyl-tRNA--protein transferase [Myxococcales bacterium]|nr:leucyl/phenylalanyl-tRNA--protein transferase [Myxococcales bacterium]